MKKRILAITLLLTCCLSADAYDTYYVPPTGTPEFQFNVYHPGESFMADDEEQSPDFEIPQKYIVPLLQSAQNWGDKLEGTPLTPLIYSYTSINDYNAAAGSPYVSVAELPYKVTRTNAKLHNWTITTPPEELAKTDGDGFVYIGLGISEQDPGWQPYTGLHPLYHNELPDISPVMLHEMMHSLGLTSASNKYESEEGATYSFFSENDNDALSIYDSQLRIYKGDSDPLTDSVNEIVPMPGPSEDATPAEIVERAIGKNMGFDVITYSPYFIGENAIKVLGDSDDYDTARQKIIDNGGMINYSDYYYDSVVPYPAVYGLPIHPTDGEGEDGNIAYDLSHIELRNSYMSHQGFRNWLTPMEVELALMNDLGYNVELRKYFGKSYYLNNQTDTYTAGFSEWNGAAYTGNPSTIDQAVGIHIYGNNNNIIQDTNDILINGEGSIGVRIDGVNNTYNLNSGNIIADGEENLGIAVTWGSGHNINIESGASVIASGEDGIAVSFDYGSNIFGTAASNIKGSYINYSADIGYNFKPDDENQSALVENFDVNGTLEGEKAAIYISDNAHVENININDGAQIKGDIISEWNSVSSVEEAKVKINDGGTWRPVDTDNPDEFYYTTLNASGNIIIDGNIKGDNEIYNTLKMINTGNITFQGEEINLNSLNNNGTISLYAPTDISITDGKITGVGDINVKSDAGIDLNEDMTYINNTVNLENGSLLSTINDKQTEIEINRLNSENAEISFDLGDKIILTNASDAGKNTAKISHIKIDEETAQNLDAGVSFDLFEDNALDLGISSANIYYGGNKYTIKQSSADLNKIEISSVDSGFELSDAVEDATAINYIVTEDSLTKNAGTVKGDEFEISGNNIDVNGYSGLVIDGTQNKSGTILETGISGASDSDLTVQNGGKLAVIASDDNIRIGENGETALTLNNGTVQLNSGENEIYIKGSIKGYDTSKDIINSSGKLVAFSDTDTVKIITENNITYLNGTSANTVWQLDSGAIGVVDDSYLASDGSNEVVINKGMINTANNKASDITLSKMTLNNGLSTSIDIDLKNFTADKFVFQDSSDLETNGNTLNILWANMLNEKTLERNTLSDEKYTIPIISEQYNNEKLLGSVINNVPSKTYLTPIFKYTFGYEENNEMAGFILTRGNSSNYNSYNPAVMVSPIAVQLGGYLSQLNSYEQAFQNLDMKMLMTREERQAYKMANRYASEVQPKVFSPTYLPEKNTAGWFRPYASFEKVGLKNGPRVENVMYGSYFGGDSDMKELNHGWDFQYSVYAGYNGSHQNYSGNSIYQNGGNLGATGIWYKKDFFTALTANVGASVADASTMYGSEDFPMLMSGIASKTGYNWELAKGRFIIQPSYLMSYTFVNTFDYTNAAGVRIKSDPLNAINITPGLKFIGNLKHGWQPYAGIQMVWNIMDKTDFKANNVALPNLSVKPYFQYGVGIQKRWGERFTGFLQAMIRNGGRNGIALSAGFRWTIGK